VTHGHADGEFEPMRGDLQEAGMNLHVVSNGEHVPEAERYIRTVKERTRCVYNTVPFKCMPSRMLVEMVQLIVFWLNMFPATDGVSDTLSPRGIIVGLKLDYTKHCQLEFRSYAPVHEEHDNSMTTRATGAIALRPKGNPRDGYYFLSLSTDRRLNRNNWTKLPTPQEVMNRVHTLARRSNINQDLTFDWHDGTAIVDEDGDDDSNADLDWEPDSDDEPDDRSVSNKNDDSSQGTDDDDDTPPDDFDLMLAGVYEGDDENENDENENGNEFIQNEIEDANDENENENEIDEVQPNIDDEEDHKTTGVDDGKTKTKTKGVGNQTT
jgi:hypothetical protein